jgi:hypothetical protein
MKTSTAGKSLLRAATRDLLPPEIADPVEAPYPTTEDARYLEALRAELARDPDNPVLALLDRPALTTAVTDGLAAGESVRTSAELVRALDLWLRSHDVRTSVSQAPRHRRSGRRRNGAGGRHEGRDGPAAAFSGFSPRARFAPFSRRCRSGQCEVRHDGERTPVRIGQWTTGQKERS